MINSQVQLSFVDHLAELRRRLLVCVVVLLLTCTVAFFFADPMLNLLLRPSGGLHLRSFSLMDGFLIKLRLAVYAGLLAAFPICAVQAYHFVKPGLYREERRLFTPFMLGIGALFAGGITFGYLLLAKMISVFIDFFPKQVEFLPSADNYLSFVLFFLFVCGFLFLFPAILLLLIKVKLLSADLLVQFRKIAYFALFAIAEIITPVADPVVAPLIIMVPLLLLYEGTILVARRLK